MPYPFSFTSLLFAFLLLALAAPRLSAQGPISGFMPNPKTTDLALSYATESFNTYLFGDQEEREMLTTESLNLFIEHGFTDTISVVLNIPYLWIDETNRGVQDGGIFLKYRNQYKEYSSGYLNLLTSVGLSFPMSGYPKDTETPIGQRAITFHGRFSGQYVSDFGLFFQLQSGVDFRIVDELQSIIPILFRAGFGAPKYYLEAWIESYNTLNGGIDTQISGGAGTDWLRIGGTLYIPIVPSFGLVLGGAKILSGRNIGLSARWNVGGVYRLKRQ